MPISTHIFKETFAFLEQNISEKFYCENFDETLTKKLYAHLAYHFDDKTLLQERAQIRKALKSYFALLNQNVSILFRGLDLIVIKDLEKHVFGVYSEQFHRMSQKLLNLSHSLEDFEVSDGTYMIPKESLIESGCSFENIEDESLKKELYRETAKIAFDLKERDLVFFMNEKLTIKKFNSSENGAERRAYGLPPEELEKLKNIVFEKNIQEEIENIVNLLMRTKLNFSLISNDYFRKNAIPSIQEALYQVASIYLNEDSHVTLKRAFVNYIFRENFTKIHKLFAQKLVEQHAFRERGAEEFLRFFDGNIEIIGGIQVQKPDIYDSNNQRWSAATILPIAISKIRSDREIQTLEESLQRTAKKIEELKEKILIAKEEVTIFQTKKDESDAILKDILEESKILQDRNYSLKIRRNRSSGNPAIQKEINELVVEIRKYSREEDRLRSISKESGNNLEIAKIKVNNLSAEIQSHDRYMKDQYKKIDNLVQTYAPVIEKFNLIVDAVAKTLMTKY